MELQDFKDNISDIYSTYKPLFSNIYDIEIYDVSSNLKQTNVSDINHYASLHAKSVSFGGDSLTTERNSVTKKFFINNNAYKWVNELSITWDESSSWEVKKFHDEWLENFYHKDTDTYVSGLTGKYKNIYVYVPNGNSKNSLKTYTLFKFINCIPSNIPSLELQWNKSPNITSHKITYYVSSYSIERDKVKN